jgi:C-terminal processing protease CtpA/Prc
VEFQFSLEHPLENVNILINRNTASAAEIVTIIMKKALGAKVYGERSYGIASLMQSTTYMGYTFYYPVSKLMFDDGADFITPDVEGVPEHLLPDGDYIDYLKK